MLLYYKFNICTSLFLKRVSEVEVRAIISTDEETSICDSSGKVFSPKCKEDSSNLYTGLMAKSHKTVTRNFTLISGGALSHLMRKTGYI